MRTVRGAHRRRTPGSPADRGDLHPLRRQGAALTRIRSEDKAVFAEIRQALLALADQPGRNGLSHGEAAESIACIYRGSGSFTRSTKAPPPSPSSTSREAPRAGAGPGPRPNGSNE